MIPVSPVLVLWLTSPTIKHGSLDPSRWTGWCSSQLWHDDAVDNRSNDLWPLPSSMLKKMCFVILSLLNVMEFHFRTATNLTDGDPHVFFWFDGGPRDFQGLPGTSTSGFGRASWTCGSSCMRRSLPGMLGGAGRSLATYGDLWF